MFNNMLELSEIDFQKYMQILDANLWPFVAEDFVETFLYSRMTCTTTLLTNVHESRKLTIKFSALPGQLGLRT